MPEMSPVQECELARVTIRAPNHVAVEWGIGDEGPEYNSRSYPSEWANEDYLGRTDYDGVMDDEELQTRIETAIDQTREYVKTIYYNGTPDSPHPDPNA
jgi:hypothetical protein